MWPRRTGIALALDLPDRAAAFRVLDLVGDQVDVIKLNYPLVLREGIGLLDELARRSSLPILADFKVADVPVTNDRILRLCADHGAAGVMLHGFIGVDALRSARAAAPSLALFIVTQLTNPGGLDFSATFSEDFARLAVMLGYEGVQAPGNRPEAVARAREIVGPDKMIVCCGIGAQGGEFGAAIRAGASYEIIGRAIYDAPDPRARVAEIRARIDPWL